MEHFASQIMQSLAAHPNWAMFFVFMVSFMESVAVIGSVVPAAAALFIAGTLIGTDQLPLWATLGWSILGAVLGDGLSYWVGYRFRDRIRNIWPFSRYPVLLDKGENFFARHGGKSVAVGRFVGPVRAVVPVIAGMVGMLPARFYLMNILSAMVWGPAHLLPGILFGASLKIAGDVTARLAVFALLLVAVVWLVLWLARTAVRAAAPPARRARDRLLDWAAHRSGFGPNLVISLLHPDHPASPTLFFSALSLFFGGWLFTYVLDHIVGEGTLVKLDKAIFHFLQAMRTDWMDQLMASFTFLGSAATLAPLAAVAALWLAWQRRYTAVLYWAVAIAVAQLLVPVLKLALSRPRPVSVTTELQLYAFPSSHSTLSMVVYGFLAFMIGREWPARRRLALMAATVLLVALIAFSRLYLGEQWLSDVVGGMSLGVAWVALLSIGYSYHQRGALHAGGLFSACVATVLCAAWWHHAHPRPEDLQPYRPTTPIAHMSETQWESDGWRRLPPYRTDIVGRPDEPFILQLVGTEDELADRLAQDGWQVPADPTPFNMLQWVNPKATVTDLPVLPRLHDGMNAGMTMIRPDPRFDDSRLVLRLWPTQYVIDDARGTAAPLWVGALTSEHVARPLSAINVSVQARVRRVDAGILRGTLGPHALERQWQPSRDQFGLAPVNVVLAPAH